MRCRAVLLSAALAGGLLGVVPARASFPNVCHPGADGVSRRALVAAPPSADGEAVAVVERLGGRVGPRLDALSLRHIELPSRAARDAAVTLLRAVPGVRSAEPDAVVRTTRVANDPLTRRQWAIGRMGLARAWDVETGKSSVVVAVLDTGVAANHPDLRGKVLPGVDVVNDDDDASDDHGHGTHVAGTVAATANNRAGVAGVAWGARVLPVKVLDSRGTGSTCDIVVGMVEAVQRGAHVLNMSLGVTTACPFAFRAAAEYATQKGALVVAASGNDALQGGAASAPGNCAGVLSVGATDAADKPAVFSTFGPQVDVSAPGVDIMSTTVDPRTGKFGYGLASGTSMAAPHVAGLAALVKSRHPDWKPDQVAAAIVSTADDRGAKGRDDFYGAGRVNAARAVSR